MPIDYSHEHFASSIIQNANPHTPIDPTGGGVSVDNGTDPPAAVTTLVAPGAVIAGSSATLPLNYRLVHVPVPYNAANLVYPDAGLLVTAFAAGEWLIDAWVGLTTLFDNGTATSIAAALVTDGPNPAAWPNSSWELLANSIDSDAATLDVQMDLHAINGSTVFGKVVSQMDGATLARAVPAKAFIDCNLRIVVYPDTAQVLTAGQADIYAIIASPAS